MMIIFLVLVVIGFTVPAFLYQTEDETMAAEPRVCQTDSDCYLFCDEKPVLVLCSQNLCQQNSCTEKSYFAFNDTPRLIQLELEINRTKIDLVNLSNPNHFFVRLNQGQLELHNLHLSLNQILEKFSSSLNGQCLTVASRQYCPSSPTANQKYNYSLQIMVNGVQNYAYGNYIPEEGDKIKIQYS